MIKIKILVLTTTLADYVGDPEGGTGNTWLEFFMEMSKYADVTIITPKTKKSTSMEKIGALTIMRVGPMKPSESLEDIIKGVKFWKVPLIFFYIWATANNCLKKESYDIIHSFWALPSGFLSTLLNTESHKLVITSLGSDIHTWSYKPIVKQITKYTVQNTDALICVSRDLCNRAIELGAKKVIYVPTPINTLKFPFHPESYEKHSIVFTGRLTRKKGIYVLADALRFIKDEIPDIKLYMCGGGPEEDAIKGYFNMRGLNNHVVFKGFISRIELTQIIKKCSAFVLPSFAEGLPTSILEAMAIGKPIITTNVGDLKEIITDDIGVIVEPGDTEELAKAIREVLCNVQYKSSIIRKTAEEFDLHKIVRSYLDIYNGLL
ncbi:MAG: glycosyltransferase [Candidatus Methanoperedens sp.]|nr:glycosyltransferase [Candidatus Methanoperedens sp.]